MTYEVVLPSAVHREACGFLLEHIRRGERQEDLCFGLWRPSTGKRRTTAIVFRLLLPDDGERDLNGNASFFGVYLARVVRTACQAGAGLVFMHNHLTPGWQPMSVEDERAERSRIAPPARTTGHPTVGLTLGTDGRWSARFWLRRGRSFRREWCRQVRVVGEEGFRTTRRPGASENLRVNRTQWRTVSTWGAEAHADLENLRVGVVGVGSVGCMVAETLARMGVRRLTLVDADSVEPHNLDRLLYAGRSDIGKAKVRLAARHLRRHATAEDFRVTELVGRIEESDCYLAALDCDLLFAAVDRPLPKDVVNHIAFVHCVPVIFGGIYAAAKTNGRLGQASWSVVTVDPERRCLRCDGQYTTSDVTMERDGSLDRPEYVRRLDGAAGPARGQNVFPFSANLASLMVLEMVRLVVGEAWWPNTGHRMQFDLMRRTLSTGRDSCREHCSVMARKTLGDQSAYPFLLESAAPTGNARGWLQRLGWMFGVGRGEAGRDR